MVESSKITLLPCDDPPSILFRVNGPSGSGFDNVIYEKVINASTEVRLGSVPSAQGVTVTVYLQIFISRNVNSLNEIGLEVCFFECTINICHPMLHVENLVCVGLWVHVFISKSVLIDMSSLCCDLLIWNTVSASLSSCPE